MIFDATLEQFEAIIGGTGSHREKGKRIAEVIRNFGGYRWVGLYDVDHSQGKVRTLAWSGPAPPAYPVFAIDQGLTGVAIAESRTVNIGNVAQDSRYLTAFSSTQSEIIVPVFDGSSERVIGTLDVESELVDAFDAGAREILEDFARAIRKLWVSSA
jgi:L-methionine (R)-S-oxide reductase